MDQMKKGAAPPSISAQTRESLAHAGDSYRDARIKAVFAMAPALGEAFTAQGMAGISVPVALTGGTADGTVPVKTNIARIVGFLPRAQVTMQEGGGHYSFLDECVPAMHPVLPLICNDLPGIERNDFHTRSLVLARDFFATNLPQNPK
jgi:predicted dienelactone hydrolase